MGQVKGLTPARQRKKTSKGFGASSGDGGGGGASGTRFSIELPLPADSPAELAGVAGELLAKMQPSAVAGASVVFASQQAAAAAAAAAAGGPLGRCACVLSLQAACRSAGGLGGPLVLVAPAAADVALVEQLLDEVWAGPWALVLNPSWHTGAPAAYQELVDSFVAAYAFTPIATQGLVAVEGAVLRQLAPGAGGPAASPWRVLLRDSRSGEFVQVGQMKRRPTQSDLELAFMNAKAASSPLTSLVKGVRGMFGGGGGAKA